MHRFQGVFHLSKKVSKQKGLPVSLYHAAMGPWAWFRFIFFQEKLASCKDVEYTTLGPLT